jgi:hypothetical protein
MQAPSEEQSESLRRLLYDVPKSVIWANLTPRGRCSEQLWTITQAITTAN